MLTLEIINNKYIFHGRSFTITKDKNTLLEPYGKMLFNYGIILSLLPNEKQTININQQIGNARFVRNNYLSERKNLYETSKETLFVSDYKKNFLPKLKEENGFLKLSDKFALESAIEHVDDAYNHFFENIKNGKKAGFPKFVDKYKESGNSYTTKYTNNNIELLMIDKLPYVKIPKVGKVRFVLPKGKTLQDIQPKNTNITSATIKRNKDTYTISLQMEAIVDKPIPITTVHVKNIIASDMGIKDFAIYGNKDYTEKVKNQRKYFHHKLSKEIVNKCDVFICEDLNIKGMIKNHKLAKAIASVGWGQFLTFVKYKMEKKGGIFLQVDRFFASSKLCNHCGYKNVNLELNNREWTCPICGVHHDRDANAKNNLFDEGISILSLNNILVI